MPRSIRADTTYAQLPRMIVTDDAAPDAGDISIDFDIGLSDHDSRGGDIMVDHIAQAILGIMPPCHRKSLMRAINNAEALLDNDITGKYSDQEYDVLRANADFEGNTLRLKLRLRIPENQNDNIDSAHANYELVGLLFLHRIFNIKADSCTLYNAPESYFATISPGKPITDIIDISFLKDVTVTRTPTKTKIDISGPKHVSYENILENWYS